MPVTISVETACPHVSILLKAPGYLPLILSEEALKNIHVPIMVVALMGRSKGLALC